MIWKFNKATFINAFRYEEARSVLMPTTLKY